MGKILMQGQRGYDHFEKLGDARTRSRIPSKLFKLITLTFASLFLMLPSKGAAQEVEWVSVFGGSGPAIDVVSAVSSDGGLYVSGSTNGALPGQTNYGQPNAFLRKYDAGGNELWTLQFDTTSVGSLRDVSVDESGVYVAGNTSHDFPGQVGAGSGDGFVRKYDIDGNEIWTRQFGTSDSDSALSVSIHSSGVYVTGNTRGAFPGEPNLGESDTYIRKYDVDGNFLWTDQFGTETFDHATGIFGTSDGVYVSGSTNGVLPGQRSFGSADAFLRKYDHDGSHIWTRQFGTPDGDSALDVSASETGVYAVGTTNDVFPGQVSAGGIDAFVRMFDSAGNHLWTQQFGTRFTNEATAVFSNSTGVYVGGNTDEALPGRSHLGHVDVFVRKYDTNGSEIWTQQFGSSEQDQSSSIVADSSGVYLGGRTVRGVLPGQIGSNSTDAFVVKHDLDGNELWVRQFGGNSGAVTDLARSVDSDGNEDLYVAGTTKGALPGNEHAGEHDAYLVKYSRDGTQQWMRQFGTAEIDEANGVSVDDSGIYVAGGLGEALTGHIGLGASDAFLRKYDVDGNEIWTRQFGTELMDQALDVTVHSAGVYVVGRTAGVFPGENSKGSNDSFLRKYDLHGNDIWTRQFGTSGVDRAERVAVNAERIYVVGDGGSDAFVWVFDTAGHELWSRKSRSVRGRSVAVDSSGVYVAGETDGTISGQTSSGLVDAFVKKYDACGNELWIDQFGTAGSDRAWGIVTSPVGPYVTGDTNDGFPGETNKGNRDAFVRLYSRDGQEVWTHQFGTLSQDIAVDVTLTTGRMHVAGWTQGSFPSQMGFGDTDGFLATFSIPDATPPTADAGGPYSGDAGSTITLNGSGSSQPKGSIVLYEWDLDDDCEFDDATGITASFTFDDIGTFTISLRVTDNEGETDIHTAVVVVSNVSPLVDAGPDDTVTEGDTFASTGNFSDPGVGNWTATVDYGDGSGQKSLPLNSDKTFDLSHTYTRADVFTVMVTVEDDVGGVGSDTAQVTVNRGPNKDPVADPGGPYTGDEGIPVTLDGSGSFDSDGEVVLYEWDLDNDGQFDDATGVNPEVTFPTAGTFTVGLKVTDDSGSTDTDTAEVTVNLPALIGDLNCDGIVNILDAVILLQHLVGISELTECGR